MSDKKETILTKEEILKQEFLKFIPQERGDGGSNYHTDTSIVNAMQEYSDQQNGRRFA
jgi:hypothetical protein